MLMQVSTMAAACAALALDHVALELGAAADEVAAAHPGLSSTLYGMEGMPDLMTAAVLRLPPGEVAAAQARGRQLDYDALIERALEIGADFSRELP